MEEKNLSEKESLALITQMISTAKNSFVDTGVGPILWGTVVTICSLVQVSEIHFNYDFPFDIWLLTIVAIIPQIYVSIQESKMKKVRTHSDETINIVWLCFGIGLMLINFINITYSLKLAPVLVDYEKLSGTSAAYLSYWNFGTSHLLFLYGLPTIITGWVRKFKVMLYGGILCWICCVLSVYTNIKTDFLLMAMCAIAAWLIPGIILRRRYLKQGKRADV
ncbi:MAG: hypothetical protein H7Y31_08615 [Chitinophagaceae bacterium]|nr:hypothetical protein [Chitinophagaceae bacterium]